MTEQDQKWRDTIQKGGKKAQQAFQDLTIFYGPKLYAQVYKMVKNEPSAKDVLQETFIKIWLNIAKFEGKSSLYSWLYRIAHNEALSFLNKEKRKSSISLDQDIIELIPGTQELQGKGPNEILDLLNQAIATLPDKQALVFELKYFQNLSYNEIQEITNTSQGALKASFHIAKEKISSFLILQLNQSLLG
ncbi:MAG: RNA polymerase sigma factor [Crocinitomicaceae bacterium]|nr:RNA polymerase sigma factor [Crocinitomicaceae bacterium]|tara:strand:+ start:28 stop:597 length:570 start_codon:yes stop_codon:yes gene_type:complete